MLSPARIVSFLVQSVQKCPTAYKVKFITLGLVIKNQRHAKKKKGNQEDKNQAIQTDAEMIQMTE